MKDANSIKKRVLGISPDERKNIMSLVEEIGTVTQKREITEDVVRKLGSVISTLESLKEDYMWRLLRAAKQNHMLD